MSLTFAITSLLPHPLKPQPCRKNNLLLPLSITTMGPSTSKRKSHAVVITGSTKGLGRALAEHFIKSNDRVVITSRTSESVKQTVLSLKNKYPNAHVFGCPADVTKYHDVVRLTDFATQNLGSLDAFICNAATIGVRSNLKDIHFAQLESVVSTNLLGPLFCAKEAMRVAEMQRDPLHVFMVDGSGTIGNATANYSAYGATKRSMPQLVKSLNKESKHSNIRFHMMSPGIVLTELLLRGNTEKTAYRIFNILAEEPETVAKDLVPRLRATVAHDSRNSYIRFLTIAKAIYRLATGYCFGFRRNKFFNEQTGKRIDCDSRNYSESGVRIQD